MLTLAVYSIDVVFVEQKLMQTCSELEDKKADKQLHVNAVNAVSSLYSMHPGRLVAYTWTQ